MDDSMLEFDDGSAALFWSMKLEANTPQEIDQPAIPGYIVHVTHACFGPNVAKQSRTVVMVNASSDSSDTSAEAPVCVLRQGAQENQQLDLLFNESATLSLKGQKVSTVYLTGYLQPPVSDDMNPDAEDMNEEELEEMLRQQALQQRELDDDMDDDAQEEPEDEDEDNEVDDEEEAEELEPPSKKQKTDKGFQSTKAANGTPKKRKIANKKAQKEAEEEEEEQTKAEEEETKADKGKKKKNKKMQNMKGGIKYRDMKPGTGKTLANGDSVNVYYVGQLDDKKVFDKAISGDGLSFTLGAGDVIKGWDMGLKGMKVGGKRKLVIPAKLAYGANGSPPSVPPNAQLTFTIEVRSAK